MAVKFDKDMLIKHRFWLLLAVTVPLVLVAVFLLITSVGAETDKVRKDTETLLTNVSSAKDVVGPATNEALQEAAEAHKASETKVHAKAYAAQEEISTFPKAVEDRFDFRNGLFATEIKILAPKEKKDWPADEVHLFHGEVTAIDEDSVTVKGREKPEKDKEGKDLEPKEKIAKFYQTSALKVSKAEKKEGERDPVFGSIREGNQLALTYYKSKYFYDPFTVAEQEHFANNYKTQIHDILKIVEPVDRQGNGVVQLKGWLYDPDDFPLPQSPFLTYVYDDWKRAAAIHREAWLAQEDLWIQKEIYRLIRQANDYVARCEPDGKQPDTFHNPNLTFHFDWKDNNMKVTVTNRLPRRQKLDLRLRVKFNKSANPATSSEIIQVADEPLEPKGAKAGAVRVVDINLDRSGIKRTGIYEVEQLLTWETAAVKRLDQIAIGAANTAHSSRTVSETPKTYRKDDVKQETKEGEGGGLTPPGGGMAGMMGGSGANMMKGGGFGGFGGGQQQAAILGVNGVLFDRYLEVSDQSRRVPVAVAMIVDQDHVDRVLTSFNNSVLRFLTTQVIINRYGNSVRPQLAGQMGDDGETRGLPGLPPMMSFGGSGSKGGRPFSPMPGGVTPGGAVPPGIDPEAGGTPGGYGMVSNEEAENNVELVIYGIVTLYERYPKRTIQVGDTKETK